MIHNFVLYELYVIVSVLWYLLSKVVPIWPDTARAEGTVLQVGLSLHVVDFLSQSQAQPYVKGFMPSARVPNR